MLNVAGVDSKNCDNKSILIIYITLDFYAFGGYIRI
jgi:hypothetical protein